VMPDLEDDEAESQPAPSSGWQPAGEIVVDTRAARAMKAKPRLLDYTIAGPVTVKKADGTTEERPSLNEEDFRQVVHGKLR